MIIFTGHINARTQKLEAQKLKAQKLESRTFRLLLWESVSFSLLDSRHVLPYRIRRTVIVQSHRPFLRIKRVGRFHEWTINHARRRAFVEHFAALEKCNTTSIVNNRRPRWDEEISLRQFVLNHGTRVLVSRKENQMEIALRHCLSPREDRSGAMYRYSLNGRQIDYPNYRNAR